MTVGVLVARQKRHHETIVDRLPRNATPAQRAEAARKLALAKSAEALTPDQVRTQQERARRVGNDDRKGRNTRTRAAQRKTAMRDQG